MTMQFFLDNICLEHSAGYGHPEQPMRIKNIIKYFDSNDLQKYVTSADGITVEKIQNILSKIHSTDMIEKVRASEKKKETYFDQDTQANDRTYLAALKAGSLAMTAGAKASITNSTFSLMRPPGHHATPQRIMGFCFFNNIALAAQNLLEKHKKVAIIDFDFHYGNGTADIFWSMPEVLYISLHADPSVNFPNQGFIDEIGSKDGKGFNVCLPLTFQAGDNEVLASFQQIVIPILQEFKPSIIGVSAGFDGYYNDPVGGGYLTYDIDGFNKIGQIIKNYSNESKTPVFHVLEGGYNIQALPELLHSYCKPWLQNQNSIGSENTVNTITEFKSREKKTFEYVKQMLRPYWNLS